MHAFFVRVAGVSLSARPFVFRSHSVSLLGRCRHPEEKKTRLSHLPYYIGSSVRCLADHRSTGSRRRYFRVRGIRRLTAPKRRKCTAATGRQCGNVIEVPGSVLDAAESKIGYQFKDRILLATSLIHSSTRSTTVVIDGVDMTKESNERLELLGDSILSLLVLDHFYRHLPGYAEGSLTAMRSLVTSGDAESEYAEQLDIARYLVVHKSTASNQSGCNTNNTLRRAYGNLLEAIVGAVYLDGGIESIRGVFEAKLLPLMINTLRTETWSWKNVLQEVLQSTGDAQPNLVYFNIDAQNSETSQFVGRCAVSYNGDRIGVGKGFSRPRAESAAAHAAIMSMGVDHIRPPFDDAGRHLAEKLEEQRLLLSGGHTNSRAPSN